MSLGCGEHGCPSRPAGEASRLGIDCVTDNNSMTHSAAAGLFLLSQGPSSLCLPHRGTLLSALTENLVT